MVIDNNNFVELCSLLPATNDKAQKILPFVIHLFTVALVDPGASLSISHALVLYGRAILFEKSIFKFPHANCPRHTPSLPEPNCNELGRHDFARSVYAYAELI